VSFAFIKQQKMITFEEVMANKNEATKHYKKVKEIEQQRLLEGWGFVKIDEHTRVFRKLDL